MPTITVKMTKALHSRLEAEAARRRTTKSAIMREAFSQRQSSAPAGSFYERARHLIGAATGPNDLATNPKHLAGYGKSRTP
ncbi:MAG: ribbon-helix-helix protein, CopG family [Opitutaceae bacterium]